MNDYRLSSRAQNDLLDIYLFGVDRFGGRQAQRYKAELDRCFAILAGQTKMGRLAPDLGPGVRRHEHGSHVILYIEEDDAILILALVHGSSVHGLEL